MDAFFEIHLGKAPPGFEPGNNGFAINSLLAWDLPKRFCDGNQLFFHRDANREITDQKSVVSDSIPCCGACAIIHLGMRGVASHESQNTFRILSLNSPPGVSRRSASRPKNANGLRSNNFILGKACTRPAPRKHRTQTGREFDYFAVDGCDCGATRERTEIESVCRDCQLSPSSTLRCTASRGVSWPHRSCAIVRSVPRNHKATKIRERGSGKSHLRIVHCCAIPRAGTSGILASVNCARLEYRTSKRNAIAASENVGELEGLRTRHPLRDHQKPSGASHTASCGCNEASSRSSQSKRNAISLAARSPHVLSTVALHPGSGGNQSALLQDSRFAPHLCNRNEKTRVIRRGASNAWTLRVSHNGAMVHQLGRSASIGSSQDSSAKFVHVLRFCTEFQFSEINQIERCAHGRAHGRCTMRSRWRVRSANRGWRPPAFELTAIADG